MSAETEVIKSDIKTAESGHYYKSSKTYAHSVGLSCAFRQWRAESHCRFIHGYALKVHLEFSNTKLDHRNWVVDFGSLKSFKALLEDLLDHKVLVAEDDPKMELFREMESQGLIQLRVVPSAGCEAIARIIFDAADVWLIDNGYATEGVQLDLVRVSEHEGNSAEYGVREVDWNDALPKIMQYAQNRLYGTGAAGTGGVYTSSSYTPEPHTPHVGAGNNAGDPNYGARGQ